MISRPIKGIIFDKDGTLFDFNATWGAWARNVFEAETAGDPDQLAPLAAALGYDLAAGRFLPESLVIASTVDEIAQAVLPLIAETDPSALIARFNAAATRAPPSGPRVAFSALALVSPRASPSPIRVKIRLPATPRPRSLRIAASSWRGSGTNGWDGDEPGDTPSLPPPAASSAAKVCFELLARHRRWLLPLLGLSCLCAVAGACLVAVLGFTGPLTFTNVLTAYYHELGMRTVVTSVVICGGALGFLAFGTLIEAIERVISRVQNAIARARDRLFFAAYII